MIEIPYAEFKFICMLCCVVYNFFFIEITLIYGIKDTHEKEWKEMVL